MSKKITRIISLLLVLCMLPITAIVASARGRGVYPTPTENQSILNAQSQYIPETVYLDGLLNDTAWDESEWNEVDTTTGYWNTQSPLTSHTSASYKYQIRADYEHVYIGAEFSLPAAETVTFTVLFKDSAVDAEGYTDKIVFEIDTTKEEDCASIKETSGITLSTGDVNGALAPEAYVLASQKIKRGDNVYYTLEFRNRIDDTFSSIENATYYVSLDLTTGDTTDSLYHPLIKLEDGVKLPDYSTWPVNSDGSAGGQPVDTLYSNTADDLDYEVKVDGVFDEAVWSSLTDFYVNGGTEEDAYNYDNSFSDDYYADLDTYKYSEGKTGSKTCGTKTYDNGMKFKYEIRVDGDYLYGAVVAYVPDFTTYSGKSELYGDVTEFTIATAPDLCIYFFDDHRSITYGTESGDTLNDEGLILPETVLQIRNFISAKDYEDYYGYASGTSGYSNMEIQTATTPDKVKCVYCDIYAYGANDTDNDGEKTDEKVVGTDGVVTSTIIDGKISSPIGGILWNGVYLDEYNNAVNAQGTRAAWYGDLYTFEFKIPIDAIPTYDADTDSEGEEIVYGICLGDRLQIDKFNVYENYTQEEVMYVEKTDTTTQTTTRSVDRHLVWTGKGDDDYKSCYYADKQVASGNYITAEQVAKAKAEKLVVANKDIFTDGYLAQEFWPGLTAADGVVNNDTTHSNVDGIESTGEDADNNIDRVAYKITSDYEFLYGACILQANGEWNADSALSLWLKREMTDAELTAYTASATGDDTIARLSLNYYSDSVYCGFESDDDKPNYVYTSTNTTYNNLSALTNGEDGTDQKNTISYDSFVAWSERTPTINFNLNGSHRVTRIDITAATLEAWGIGFPDSYEIQYSLDGTNWSSVGHSVSSSEKAITNTSTDVHAEFGISVFHLTLNEAVEAKYLRVKVNPKTVTIGEIDHHYIFLSEFTFYGEQKAYAYEHYNFTLNLDSGNVTDFTQTRYTGHLPNNGSTYTDGDATVNDISQNNIQTFVKDIEKDGKYYKAVEFRIPLSSLGIELNLENTESNKNLFGYYISADDGDGNILSHPKNKDGDSAEKITKVYNSDYDGAKQFAYADMLQDIVIDGELNEKYWIGDDDTANPDEIMTHVDSTNGSYKNEPTKGNSLDFDYKIYAGENYLYGAAIIDSGAVAADEEYQWSDYCTRFDIWIDNKIDEYDWIDDGNAFTNMEFAPDQYQDSYKPEGGTETYTYTASQAYENYYYNIYLADAQAASGTAGIESASGGYACGGSTPTWYNDANDYGKFVNISRENWSWAATTINGKTYIEFMISLDNFHCDRSEGFNYYVSATQVFDKDTDNEESLTLVYPSIEESTYDFWVTHYNYNKVTLPSGAGIIFDNADAFKKVLTDTTPDNENAQVGRWERALFVPVSGKTNTYKLVWLQHGNDSSTDFTANLSSEYASFDAILETSGWFGYMVHTGRSEDGYVLIPEARSMWHAINKKSESDYECWEVGDEFVFTGIDLGNCSGTLKYTASTEYNTAALVSPAYSEKLSTTDTESYSKDGYECNYTVTRIAKGTTSVTVETAAYIANIPTETVWESGNAGIIDAIEHFAPDVITVDGILNENVWNEDEGWTDVHDRINGSYQEGSTNNTSAEFSYKIRFDGEYMYVGAIIDAEYGEAENPNFRIWIKSDDDANTFTHFYHIAYGENAVAVTTVPTANYDTATDYGYVGYRDGITYGVDEDQNNILKYENLLVFGKNNNVTVPHGTSDFTEKTDYEDSALFGYSEEIQENTAWQYYPVINSTKYYLGKESANMTATADGKTQVEFKVKISEFGGENGFEYFVQAAKIVDGAYATLYYPGIYTEPKSKWCYWSNNQVFWDWFSNTAEKIGADEMNAMRLRNHNYPVTTLGAKISSDYVVDGTSYNAIRFGGLYNEDYIRNWVAESNGTEIDQTGTEYYTDPNLVDYWDIADVGIVIQPTDELEDTQGEDLWVGNEGSYNDSADNIVSWQTGVDNWGTNFADYENFAFYVTIYGIPEEDLDRKFSFRGYVDFYASTGIESYYDTTLVRSYNMVDAVVNGGTSNEDEALPDDSPVIAYVPLDNRPVNVERIEYLTGATDFTLLMPDEEIIATTLDASDGDADTYGTHGNPEAVFEWLQSEYVVNNADYYVLSLDQLCSGGLVHSRYETDSDNTFEYQVCDYVVSLAQTKQVVLFDTVMRLASTDGYMGLDYDTYEAVRAIGQRERLKLEADDIAYIVNNSNFTNLYFSYTHYQWTDYENNIEYLVNMTYGDEDKDYSAIYAQHVESRKRKILITDHLLRAAASEDVSDKLTIYIGVDDSSPDNTVQTNDIKYIEALAELAKENYVAVHLSAGTDELGLMGIATCSNLRYGGNGFEYNVTYFGETCESYADDYDYQSLNDNLEAHLKALGGEDVDTVDNDVLQVLVLTRYEVESTRAEYAAELIKTANEYLKNNYPVCIIDGSAYSYTELPIALCTDLNNTGKLLGYSNWNTVGNSIGIALSNAVARFNYISNETVTDESNEEFLKTLTFSLVKDISYQLLRTQIVEDTLADNGMFTEDQAETFLNSDSQPYAPESIIQKLEASEILVGIDETIAHGKNIDISDLVYTWGRRFEAEFTITVNTKTEN